ncbi:MAG: cytosine deaminase [Alistipes sp.]|nr:cytosine deaminase [Alistipes sp.]
MNFSEPFVPQPRKIASNLLWTPQGVVRSPLATLDADGRVLCVEQCPDPDRRAATEFYAGLLVAEFPAAFREAFERLKTDGRPLSESLAECVPAPGGVPVIISGLDYDTLLPTSRSRIRRL